MRILITGVTGFLGQSLVARFVREGHEIIGVSRRPAAAQAKVPALSGAWSLDEPFPESVDAVVHLAGEPVVGRWTREKRRRIMDSRVEGTRRLVARLAELEVPPKVLVSASGIGYYGEPPAEAELVEASPAGSDFLAEVCVGWEREALAAEAHGIRVVPMRIGIVLGLGGGALQQMMPIFKMGLGGKIGRGDQWWSWIHEDDLCAVIAFALDQESLRGVINVVSPEPVRQGVFAKTLAKVLRRPAFMPAPAFAIKTALGGFSTEILTSRRVVPQALLDAGFAFQYPELHAALVHALG